MKPAQPTTLITFDGLHRGGAERHIVDLACGLTRLGLRRVVVATSGGPLEVELEAAGVAHEYVAHSGHMPWSLLYRAWRLNRLVRKHGASVLHSHSRVTNLASALAVKLFGAPAVHIATAHNVYPDKHRLGCWPTTTVCVSNAAERYVRAHSHARTRVIVNGVRRPEFRASRSDMRRALGISPDAIVIVNVGRLSEQKAQYLLIEAFARLVGREPSLPLHLLLVGEGELRDRCEKLVAELDLQDVATFTGARDDVFDLLAASDIFALSSRWEGLGLVLVEAAACGLPLVAFEVGGVGEAVDNGGNGFLVAPQDTAAMAETLHRLALDKALRARMGATGKALFESKFSLERCIRATADVYRTVEWRQTS